MPIATAAPGRPPARQREIANRLRQRIVRGELAPQARLPGRRELSEQFGASMATVQQALQRLAAEGFVAVQGTQGTFVHANPPHLAQYVLLFPCPPADMALNRYWRALEQEARRYPTIGMARLRVVMCSAPQEGAGPYAELLDDVRHRRVAGLIFASDPWCFRATPLVTTPGVARAAIGLDRAAYPQIAAVEFDIGSWIDRALAVCVARGRRRVASLMLPQAEAVYGPLLRAALAARGLEARPYWHHLVLQAFPQCGRSLTHLLMQVPAADRPDALLIMDDNLVEHATGGLVAAGAHIPADIEVVAHCNFPWPTPSVVPVRRLGFDTKAALRACLEACQRQHQGETAPAPVALSAVFEEETLAKI